MVREVISRVELGPTLLIRVGLHVSEAVFLHTINPVLYTLAMIGLPPYVFLVGAELDYF